MSNKDGLSCTIQHLQVWLFTTSVATKQVFVNNTWKPCFIKIIPGFISLWSTYPVISFIRDTTLSWPVICNLGYMLLAFSLYLITINYTFSVTLLLYYLWIQFHHKYQSTQLLLMLDPQSHRLYSSCNFVINRVIIILKHTIYSFGIKIFYQWLGLELNLGLL